MRLYIKEEKQDELFVTLKCELWWEFKDNLGKMKHKVNQLIQLDNNYFEEDMHFIEESKIEVENYRGVLTVYVFFKVRHTYKELYDKFRKELNDKFNPYSFSVLG